MLGCTFTPQFADVLGLAAVLKCKSVVVKAGLAHTSLPAPWLRQSSSLACAGVVRRVLLDVVSGVNNPGYD